MHRWIIYSRVSRSRVRVGRRRYVDVRLRVERDPRRPATRESLDVVVRSNRGRLSRAAKRKALRKNGIVQRRAQRICFCERRPSAPALRSESDRYREPYRDRTRRVTVDGTVAAFVGHLVSVAFALFPPPSRRNSHLASHISVFYFAIRLASTRHPTGRTARRWSGARRGAVGVALERRDSSLDSTTSSLHSNFQNSPSGGAPLAAAPPALGRTPVSAAAFGCTCYRLH